MADAVGADRLQRNKEKPYHKINDTPEDSAGRMLFLQHELMISRFDFMVELGRKKSEGQVELADWKQVPPLHAALLTWIPAKSCLIARMPFSLCTFQKGLKVNGKATAPLFPARLISGPVARWRSSS